MTQADPINQNIDSPPEQESERFKTRQEAYTWLISQGGKVSVGKFYQDGKRGLYRTYPDKSVSRGSVAEYLLRLNGAAPVPDLELVDWSQQKQKLEVRRLQLEVDKLELANRSADRAWVRTDDHWAHLAASLVLLKGDLEHYARLAASELVGSCQGDFHLAPQLGDKVVELVVARAFNDLAVQRIESGLFEETEGETDERE